MKKHILLLLSLISSCIVTDISYIDDFKGNWECHQLPMGDCIDEMSLYIENDRIEVVIDDTVYIKDYIISNQILICGWTIKTEYVEILFLDMFLHNGNLILRWKPIDFYYPYTTVFKRI